MKNSGQADSATRKHRPNQMRGISHPRSLLMRPPQATRWSQKIRAFALSAQILLPPCSAGKNATARPAVHIFSSSERRLQTTSPHQGNLAREDARPSLKPTIRPPCPFCTSRKAPAFLSCRHLLIARINVGAKVVAGYAQLNLYLQNKNRICHMPFFQPPRNRALPRSEQLSKCRLTARIFNSFAQRF